MDYHTRKRRDHSKNKKYARLYYKCKSPDHIVADCPYNSDNEDNEKKKNKKEKKEKKEKKMTFKKKKGGYYVVTWDSDASTDDDSSDDDKASKKKALASIAINNKPSLFNTTSCFMAKGSKVKYDKSDNSECESDSDDDNEFSNEQLMNMLEQANSIINKKSKKCKDLQNKLDALEQSFNELNATHERLEKAYEKLGKAHIKLEKTHSLLLEQDKERKIISCDVGITYDLIDESFYEPIIIAPTNPSCSSSSTTITTSTSTTSDGFTCDGSLMIENETLKREVDELTHALGKAYGGEACLLKCLGSQRTSLNKEGLCYTPKKDKVAFATPKASFVKSNGRYYNRCKQVRHLEQYCKNKNKNANVSSIKFDFCYLLTKGVNGVKAKFIGVDIS
jgi:hypothetical protein